MTRHLVGEIGLLAGSLLILVAGIGVLRFPDVFTRMHALSKASTAGVALALIGTAVAAAGVNEVMSLLFATALQAATNPVASTLLVQSTYYAEGIATPTDTVDELAAFSAASGAADGAAPRVAADPPTAS